MTHEMIQQKLLEYLENSHDFILDEMPEVIQQALTYERLSALFTAVLMFVLIITACTVFYYCWMNPSLDKYGSRNMSNVMGMVIPGSFMGLFTVTFCSSFDKLLKIYIAPKYYLIQLFVDIKN